MRSAVTCSLLLLLLLAPQAVLATPRPAHHSAAPTTLTPSADDSPAAAAPASFPATPSPPTFVDLGWHPTFPDEPAASTAGLHIQLLATELAAAADPKHARPTDAATLVDGKQLRLLLRLSATPTADTAAALADRGLHLKPNPWRDAVDTPHTDEAVPHIRLSDAALATMLAQRGHPLPIHTTSGPLTLDGLRALHPGASAGALLDWLAAAGGDPRAALHAPTPHHPDLQHVGDVWYATATPTSAAALSEPLRWSAILTDVPTLREAELDHRLVEHTPLDVAREVIGSSTTLDGAHPAAWNLTTFGAPITGVGVRVADLDTGIDILHPAFFRADTARISWVDQDGDGNFDHGTDGLDLDNSGTVGAGERLRRLVNGNGANGPGTDTYWLDEDDDSSRDHGPSDGYGDANASFGEPLYQAMDEDGDGVQEVSETFVLLNHSKVLAAWDPLSNETVRGVDISETGDDADGHGTSVQGIIVANQEHHTLAGQAPGAELLSYDGFSGGWAAAQSWSLQRGADVMLYEVGSWVDDHLDGSSLVERTVDSMARAGVTQISAAGNLGGRNKVMQGTLPAENASGDHIELRFNVPSSQPSGVYAAVLMPDAAVVDRLEIRPPGGNWTNLSNQTGIISLDGGMSASITRSTSTRNTNLVVLYLWATGGVTNGIWSWRMAGPAGASDTLLRGYLSDSDSSWSGGVTWREPIPDALGDRGDNGTVIWPATADEAITIASWAPRGRAGVSAGGLAASSGRGTRINDQMPLIDVASPGNFDVWSPDSDNRNGVAHGRYRWFGGTSAAAASAAAAAALIMQRNPLSGHAQVWQAFNASSTWNATTGELWNVITRLTGAVGDPSHVAGWTGANGSNGSRPAGLSDPIGTPLGDGLLVGDPLPGVLAPSTDWGWGYLRVDRALTRDWDPPSMSAPPVTVIIAGDRANISVNYTDNAQDVAADHSVRATCVEFATNAMLRTPANVSAGDTVSCGFGSVGTHIIEILLTDAARNVGRVDVAVHSIFGRAAAMRHSPVPANLTTDDQIWLEASLLSANLLQRPVDAAEWITGLTVPTGVRVNVTNDGTVLLDLDRVGSHVVSLEVDDLLAEWTIPVGFGNWTDVEARPVGTGQLTPDAPLSFEVRWADSDVNRAPWEPLEDHTGRLLWTGYGAPSGRMGLNGSAVEADQPSIGRWNGTVWWPLAEGEHTLWLALADDLGREHGRAVRVDVSPGAADRVVPLTVAALCTAGETVELRVGLRDAAGNELPASEPVLGLSTSSTGATRLDTVLESLGSPEGGVATVRCLRAGEHWIMLSLGGLDPVTVLLEVEPGPLAVLRAHADTTDLVAGEFVTVSVEAEDVEGNRLVVEVQAQAGPGMSSVPGAGLTWRAETAGATWVEISAGQEAVRILLSVVAAAPTELTITPHEVILDWNGTAALDLSARDAWGNPLTLGWSDLVLVTNTSSLAVVDGHLRAREEGHHNLTWQVAALGEAGPEATVHVLVLGDRDGDGDGEPDRRDHFPDDANLSEPLDIEGSANATAPADDLIPLFVGVGLTVLVLTIALLIGASLRGKDAAQPPPPHAAPHRPFGTWAPLPPPPAATTAPPGWHSSAPLSAPGHDPQADVGRSIEELVGLPAAPPAPAANHTPPRHQPAGPSLTEAMAALGPTPAPEPPGPTPAPAPTHSAPPSRPSAALPTHQSTPPSTPTGDSGIQTDLSWAFDDL